MLRQLRPRPLVSLANRVARAKAPASGRAKCLHTIVAHEPLVPALPSPGVSHWKSDEAVLFTRESVLDLLYGKTPLIREPDFLTPEECSKYEQAFSPLLTPYKHNTGPVLRKVGVAQFEYQAQSQADFANRSNGSSVSGKDTVTAPIDFYTEQDRYFKDTKDYKEFHSKLASEQGMDAWFRVFNRMSELFPEWDVRIASEGPGRQYFSGIFRALNDSTHLHCDFSPYDSMTEDWIISKVQCQIVFNLYLAPVINGRTIIYDVQWTRDSLKYRDPDSYGYDHKLVAGARKVSCEPTLGALCMFNSRNMHQVEPVTAEKMPSLGLSYRPRLTLSSFMGLLPSSKTGGKPQFLFWS